MCLLVLVVLLRWAAPAASAPTLVPLSEDPYGNPDSRHATAVEPASFAWRRTLVAAFQVGRRRDGGATNIGWATSTTRGRRWSTGLLPATTIHTTPAGAYVAVSDPSVAYDRRHRTWLVSFLGIVDARATDVLASRSTDGGRTWSAPLPVDGSGTSSRVFNDKNWTTCDNSPRSLWFGRCYTAYTDLGAGGVMVVSASSDGGLTWGPPRTTVAGAPGQGVQPVVRPARR